MVKLGLFKLIKICTLIVLMLLLFACSDDQNNPYQENYDKKKEEAPLPESDPLPDTETDDVVYASVDSFWITNEEFQGRAKLK